MSNARCPACGFADHAPCRACVGAGVVPPAKSHINEFELGRVLFEARKREAWGQLAQQMIERDPWPKHVAAPRSAEHDLALAQARAVIQHLSPVAA